MFLLYKWQLVSINEYKGYPEVPKLTARIENDK
jgi:hypothetical protein